MLCAHTLPGRFVPIAGGKTDKCTWEQNTHVSTGEGTCFDSEQVSDSPCFSIREAADCEKNTKCEWKEPTDYGNDDAYASNSTGYGYGGSTYNGEDGYNGYEYDYDYGEGAVQALNNDRYPKGCFAYYHYFYFNSPSSGNGMGDGNSALICRKGEHLSTHSANTLSCCLFSFVCVPF